MSSSTSTPGTETASKSNYERLPSITTQNSRVNETETSNLDKGKGRELEIRTPSGSQRTIGRERSPTPSMLTRRKTDGEAIKSNRGLMSAGIAEKKVRVIEGGKKKDIMKRRHSSNDTHTNIYTECGRHSDDWLFGGFSVSGVVKKIWQKDGKDSG